LFIEIAISPYQPYYLSLGFYNKLNQPLFTSTVESLLNFLATETTLLKKPGTQP